MKIAHVLTPARAGGAETVVESLAVGQHQAGHDVRVGAVLLAERDDPPLVTALEEAGVRVQTWPLDPRAYLQEAAHVRRLCEAFQPDVLHTHGYRSDVVAGYATRALDVPRATTVHGFCGGDLRNRFYEHLQRRAYRSFEAVVAVSRALGEDLVQDHGLDRSRVHVIPNARPVGLDFLERSEARKTLGVPAEAPVVGWIGRLSHEKGLDVLLRAAARRTGHDFRLLVVGDGKEKATLRTLAEDLGIDDRVTWSGHVPHAARLIRAFDVLCLSSRTEGLPMVLLEAMAAGVPIVATHVGGVPEAVSEREARLVPPESPAALADAIAEALQDRAQAGARARRAAKRLRREFSRESWLSRYDEVYRGITPATARAAS